MDYKKIVQQQVEQLMPEFKVPIANRDDQFVERW